MNINLSGDENAFNAFVWYLGLATVSPRETASVRASAAYGAETISVRFVSLTRWINFSIF